MSPWQAGRRRHSHSHSPGNAGLAALAGDAQARNRRLWASAGLAYVGAVALYVREIPFRRGNVRTKKKILETNKTNSSRRSRPTWYMRCMLIKMSKIVLRLLLLPAPCCLPPPQSPTTHGNCVRRFVCDCVLLSLSLSLSALLDMDLGCWAHARIFRFNWQTQPPPGWQHQRGTANDDAKCAEHTHIGGPGAGAGPGPGPNAFV